MDARMKWNCPNPTLAAFSVLHVDSSIPLYVPRPTRRCAKRDRRAVPDMGYLLAAVAMTRGRKTGDNMKTTKVALGVVAAVLIAVLAGYLWGSAGRRTAEREVQGVTLRIDLIEARGALLAARVDLYNVNFGNASRHLQEA